MLGVPTIRSWNPAVSAYSVAPVDERKILPRGPCQHAEHDSTSLLFGIPYGSVAGVQVRRTGDGIGVGTVPFGLNRTTPFFPGI